MVTKSDQKILHGDQNYKKGVKKDYFMVTKVR